MTRVHYLDIYWRRILHLYELSVRRLIRRGINSRDDFTWIFSLRKGLDKKSEANAFWVSLSERALDKFPKCIAREGLGSRHTGNRQSEGWIVGWQSVWLYWKQWTPISYYQLVYNSREKTKMARQRRSDHDLNWRKKNEYKPSDERDTSPS